MVRPTQFHYLIRIVLAIPMFIATILFIVAGAKLHKHLFIGLGVIFAIFSLYCVYFLLTSLCWGVCRLQERGGICRALYYCCCTCFINDTECCASQEGNHCPCIKWCCVDDEEAARESAKVNQLTDVITDQAEVAVVTPSSPDGAAESLLLKNASYPAHDGAHGSMAHTEPPIYSAKRPPKYEGW